MREKDSLSIATKSRRNPSTLTKAQIKKTAQLLFAKYAVDNVSVQQILHASGQKNNAALHYHFGSKEDLIREIIVDGAKVLDNRRREMLDKSRKDGGPKTIREVIEILVLPVLELQENPDFYGYIRFTSQIHSFKREILERALEGKWNAAYAECLSIMQELSHLPKKITKQRISLFIIYANAILSMRDVAIENNNSGESRLWGTAYITENMLDTFETMFITNPSDKTMTLHDLTTQLPI